MELIGGVVNGVEAGGRVFDAAIVVQPIHRDEIIHRPGMPAIFHARLQPVPATAIHRHGQPGIGQPGLGLNVHHARGLKSILCRQRTGDQRQRSREPFLEHLPEHRQALRQLHPIQPVLHVGVLPAQVDLPETVLRHARGLQQHLVQRCIVALRDVAQRVRRE